MNAVDISYLIAKGGSGLDRVVIGPDESGFSNGGAHDAIRSITDWKERLEKYRGPIMIVGLKWLD